MPAVEYPKTTLIFVPKTEKESTLEFFSGISAVPNYGPLDKQEFYIDSIIPQIADRISSSSLITVKNVQERSGHADWSFDFYGVPESFRVMRNTSALEVYFRGGHSLRVSLADAQASSFVY